MGEILEEYIKKPFITLMIGVLFGLLLSAVILLISSPPRANAIRILPTATQSPLTVDVGGAVAHPGIYQLPVNSRINDAILAAGGSVPEANLDSINRAALIKDGTKIYIPVQGEQITLDSSSSNSSFVLININTATQKELEALPGIGPGKAGDIIEYRQNHGDFDTIDEIQNVSGIGESLFQQIKDQITTTP
jgi:competence protein ComEA